MIGTVRFDEQQHSGCEAQRIKGFEVPGIIKKHARQSITAGTVQVEVKEFEIMKFRSKKIAAFAVTSCLGVAALTPALAHHSFAMFDQTRISKTAEATVTQFRFTNPHSFVVVNVRERGAMKRYVFECSSVNMMTKGGWKHNVIKAGDKVDVTFYPLRNGKPGGMLKTIELPDGRTLSGW